MRDEKQVPVPSSTSAQSARQPDSKVGLRGCWELLIKLIILLILILILLAYWFGLGPFGPRGNFGTRGEYDLWVWFWLLLLILLLLFLIWRQKHFVFLNCALTQPQGCKHGNTQLLAGRLLEPIIGTASGIGFSRYLLEVRYAGAAIPGAIIYADGGGNPDTSLTHGNHQVTSGKLGFVDLQVAAAGAGAQLYNSANFEVRLHVVGIDSSEHVCATTFQLALEVAAIKKVGAAWAHDYINQNEMLCRVPAPGAPSPGPHVINPASVGSDNNGIYVRGSAWSYGCDAEQIAELHMWAIPDENFSFAQPAAGTSPITPPAIPGTVQISVVVFTDNSQRASNPLDLPSDEGAILTYAPGWTTRTDHFYIPQPFPLPPIDIPVVVPDLTEIGWVTPATGKYTLLLALLDTAGNTFYDIQRVWVDNDPVIAKITSIGGLTGCLDLRLSDFQKTTCEIRGFAWDRAIRVLDPQAAPNDNFGGYGLGYQKNGVPGGLSIAPATPGVRVPNVWDETPPAADDVLANWDIVADLDNGASPPPAGSHKLQRGTRCAFNISLGVSDTTLVGEGGASHSNSFNFAVNIINDL
ncbi:MAG: hypothetical protein QOE46_2637 [Acidobacteriota bacterium]|jgi:uncharacterized integral membrane protein|nr:hypothetical protein [Acidobacteriota bacterium]